MFFTQDIDRNKDGLISLDEFLGDYRDPEDTEADEPEWVKEETKKFKEEYDKNNDGKLDNNEVSWYYFSVTVGSYCHNHAGVVCFRGSDNGEQQKENIAKWPSV